MNVKYVHNIVSTLHYITFPLDCERCRVCMTAVRRDTLTVETILDCRLLLDLCRTTNAQEMYVFTCVCMFIYMRLVMVWTINLLHFYKSHVLLFLFLFSPMLFFFPVYIRASCRVLNNVTILSIIYNYCLLASGPQSFGSSVRRLDCTNSSAT